MGNRQLANHNTEDVKFNLNEICNLKFEKTGNLPDKLQLVLKTPSKIKSATYL